MAGDSVVSVQDHGNYSSLFHTLGYSFYCKKRFRFCSHFVLNLFHDYSGMFKFVLDVDECQSGYSTCNPDSENCFNNIGNYRCECKDGFVNMSGVCDGR